MTSTNRNIKRVKSCECLDFFEL